MEGFTADYLANLTAELTADLIRFAGSKAQEALLGPEEQQAVRRCTEAGVIALLAQATADAPEETELETIFRAFFEDPQTAREISKLLRGRRLDGEELLFLFEEAGFDAETLPGLDFAQSIAAFESAFVETAIGENSLQGHTQTGNLVEQTRLNRELLDKVQTIIRLLSELEPGTVGIQAGQIHADNVVNGPQIIYQWRGTPPPNPADPAAGLRRDYLNHLFEDANRMSLAGVDPKAASDAEARLNLSAVYTGLMTLTPEDCARLQRGEVARGAVAYDDLGRGVPRLSAVAQLDAHRHLVLLGGPGSGKSTFVNFVALCLAGEALRYENANIARLTEPLPRDETEELRLRLQDEPEDPKPQPWSHGTLLPVRVILRDFAARGLPAPGRPTSGDTLWSFIAGSLGETLADFAPALKQHLHDEGGLLLLDGLDEVPEAEERRVQICRAVEDFAASFSKVHILVTSRTYAYQQQAWRLEGFNEAVLAPFSASQIARFVDRWYAHIARVRNLNGADAQGRAELLKRAIRARDRLQELAARPLLLTLMASLHAWRGGSLPDKREQLYADTIDLLLDWWENQRIVRDSNGDVIIIQPSLAEWLKVDRPKVRRLLSQLAYAAHSSQPELTGTADIPEADLVSGLLRLSPDPEVKPKRLLEFLSLRAGLLLPRGVGVYTFPHRTFQEYLAALHLVVHGYPANVSNLARTEPDRWREVALLAGAATTARGSEFALWALVEELCPQSILSDERQAPDDAWGALLAGQILVESADLANVTGRDRPKANRVVAHLVRILEAGEFPAVERAAAGVALAKLGDPRPGVGVVGKAGLPDIVWCEVPAGRFVRGSRDNSLSLVGKETPQSRVAVPAFRISRYPITHAQFAAFVAAGGYKISRYWHAAETAGVWSAGKVKGPFDEESRGKPTDYGDPFNLLNHPVVGVTGYEALAFCLWLGESLETRIMLPSETQWEKASRGTDGWTYPWGNTFDADYVNSSETGIGSTSAVGCFPGGDSPYGVADTSGNVWEWCVTKWEKSYEKYADDNGLEGKEPRVLRGGAFLTDEEYVRCAYRYRYYPNLSSNGLGFRVVASPIPQISDASGL